MTLIFRLGLNVFFDEKGAEIQPPLFASVRDNQLLGMFGSVVVDAVSYGDGFEGKVFEQVADWLDVV